MGVSVSDMLDIADYFFKNYSYRLMDFLPLSPAITTDFFELGGQYLGWLNWFFPVGQCLDFMGYSLLGVAVYYGSRVILKRMNII